MQLGSIGVPELLVVLLVVLLVFGPKRLPEVARGLARSVREFRHGLEHGLEEEPPAGTAAAPLPGAADPARAAGPKDGPVNGNEGGPRST